MPLHPAAIESSFAAHEPALMLYARQFLPGEDAREVVQEAFIRLIEQRSPPENDRAWLFRAVRNLAISWSRSQRRRRARERHAARPDWFQSRPEDLVDAAAAQAAMESLPVELREIVVLRIWGGLTLAEVARITGLAVSSVFDRYRAGLSEIKQRMKTPCETPKT